MTPSPRLSSLWKFLAMISKINQDFFFFTDYSLALWNDFSCCIIFFIYFLSWFTGSPFLKDEKLKYWNTVVCSEPSKHKEVESDMRDPWVDYLDFKLLNKLFLYKVIAIMNSLCENEELLFWHLGSRSFTWGGIFLAEIVCQSLQKLQSIVLEKSIVKDCVGQIPGIRRW